MANATMAWAFRAHVSPEAKIVLLTLADISDRNGRANFSLESLAHDCSTTIPRVENSIAELIQKKLVVLRPSDKPERKIEQWLETILLVHRNSEEEN